MSAEVPAWLGSALSRTKPYPTAAQSITLEVGQIRRLEPMDAGSADPLLVLVMAVADCNASASVAVLSPEIEMGTDADLSLPRRISGLPYDLVVLPDVVVQLGALTPAGIQLRDSQDSRWSWKEGMLEALLAITAECRYQLIDGDPAAIADPAAFDLEHVGVEDRTRMTLATVRLLDVGAIRVPVAALRVAPAVSTSPAYESFMALSQAIQRRSSLLIQDEPIPILETDLLRSIVNDPLLHAVTGMSSRLDDSVRCIRVASVSALWGERPEPDKQVFEVVLKGKRLQVVVAHVDSPGAFVV
ncbi:hypothetical protein [Mycolicibacterium sp. CBMA 361]|uniref:hypothetical protein n=1 Tax=Mycolicibacterium sp. CBMA 361 TaxID=2606610 RepID=UPI0012DF0230|nr:hypothetical protein [Mycolicibacterium sp. CBMA 361]MUM30546.1 hypothetical protein [Mycolicibacterium sp. CBMA 361]